MAIDVYNLDHDISSDWKFRIGSYQFEVQAGPQTRKDVFARGVSTSFQPVLDDQGNIVPTTSTKPANLGEWSVTASIDDHSDLHAASILFPNVPTLTGADDLALILTLLTGREVAIGLDAKQKYPLRPGESVVCPNFFHLHTNTIAWEKLPKIASTGASESIYTVCEAMLAGDLIAKLALGFAALENLVSQWHEQAGITAYTKDIKSKISRAKEKFKQALLDEEMPQAIVDDIIPRMGNISTESALVKLKSFLVAHGMYPSLDTPTVFGRLQSLNVVRNGFAHRCKINVKGKLPFEFETQLAGALVLLALLICRVYIAKHLLEIDDGDYGIEKERKVVLDFFLTGKYRGQDVAGELYDDYMKRLVADWMSTGELPN